jgi:hypothetical protein
MTANHPSPIVHEAARQFFRAALFLMILVFQGSNLWAEVQGNSKEESFETLPLPRWSEQELRSFRESLPATGSQGVLFPEHGGMATDINELMRAPLPTGPRLEHLFNGHEAEISPRLKPEDMRLFLPESILGNLPQNNPAGTRLPTPVSSIREVSPEFMHVCERSHPEDYVIDPEHLVPEMQNHDIAGFLEFHARDASIKLHVLVIAHDHRLPADADLGKVASGGLLQRDACLLVYPLGEPWRARLFVSKSVHEQTSGAFLSETAKACLQEALQASDVHDQLHRYAVHLSTRLFWLQRALAGETSVDSKKDQSLAEITPEITARMEQPEDWSIVVSIMPWLCLVTLVSVVLQKVVRQRRLKRQKSVWLLPEPETIPRLGGAFTGGGGGMIRYG